MASAIEKQELISNFLEKKTASGEQVAKIFADERESEEVISGLRARGAEVQVRILDISDFIVSERAAVERKTRSDFEQSIIDGRLFEQAARLQAAFERVVIIVEGEKFQERINKKALLGAVSSLILDYGFSVFFTKDGDKTAEMIYALAFREQLAQKRELKLVSNKRANTLAQMQQIMVESLPGLGPKLAKSLLSHFGSVENIVNANEKELQEIEKLGPKKAKLIKKILTSAYTED
ncbi:3'-flap repair endonuclease Xpf [Candidatus Gugararchaeum adminiculabundum]|nr:3'-flap repair endonuclease Xpf [Candidatus Gugararchaeum adminiculabundum]